MSRNFGDLNVLIEWARQKGISVSVSYWESGDELSIETVSAAPAECYSEKRVVDIGTFMWHWEENLKTKQLAAQDMMMSTTTKQRR